MYLRGVEMLGWFDDGMWEEGGERAGGDAHGEAARAGRQRRDGEDARPDADGPRADEVAHVGGEEGERGAWRVRRHKYESKAVSCGSRRRRWRCCGRVGWRGGAAIRRILKVHGCVGAGGRCRRRVVSVQAGVLGRCCCCCGLLGGRMRGRHRALGRCVPAHAPSQQQRRELCSTTRERPAGCRGRRCEVAPAVARRAQAGGVRRDIEGQEDLVVQVRRVGAHGYEVLRRVGRMWGRILVRFLPGHGSSSSSPGGRRGRAVAGP